MGAGQIRHRLPQLVQEGDVIGVAYDHLELQFFLNGVDLQVASAGIKGEEVYPVVYGELCRCTGSGILSSLIRGFRVTSNNQSHFTRDRIIFQLTEEL